MPNAIKYNLSAETLALKKGNFYIGTGDVGKGPTSSTGYYNGITPPSGGYTIYLNKASGGPSIYTVNTEAQLTGLTNTLSVSTNLIKNNNGGNFADGTIAPFTGDYGTLPTIVDITNDKPYNGSTSTKAAKFIAGGGMNIYTEPSPFTMTVGVTYTFSFWYRQTNSNNFYIGFNNQGGSGDVNGNFQAYSSYGYFLNPTQTWQRCSWTFTNVVNKVYFFIYSFSSVAGSECLMTEFTLTEGSMPSGPGLTTSGNCLNWFGSIPTDKMIFNRDYESIVTNGLVLNLDAGFSPSFATIPSNTNGNTLPSWYDLSGNGNNGTLTNGPTYSSIGGGSIVFDGVDDYAQITSPFGNIDWSSRAWSFSAWMKLNSLGDRCLVNLNSANSTDYIVTNVFYSNGGSYWYFIKNSASTQTNFTTPGGTFTTNEIFYFTMTYNGNGLSTSNINFYKNGTQVATSGGGSAGLGNMSGLQIGGGNNYPMNGNVYNFLMYNREISSLEVLQNYNAQKGRFGL
jgi:hypothetical protein